MNIYERFHLSGTFLLYTKNQNTSQNSILNSQLNPQIYLSGKITTRFLEEYCDFDVYKVMIFSEKKKISSFFAMGQRY
jgi:hypothetical protein